MEISDVNLFDYQDFLKFKTEAGKRYIFDPIRRKYLVLQPEELVRQLLLQYLIQEKKYNTKRIAVEMGLKVNELSKRCDILLYSEALAPFLLVECKAPQVEIDEAVFEQIARYNLHFRVPFLLVSNGRSHYCCRIYWEEERFEFLSQIPAPDDTY